MKSKDGLKLRYVLGKEELFEEALGEGRQGSLECIVGGGCLFFDGCWSDSFGVGCFVVGGRRRHTKMKQWNENRCQ